MPQPNSPNITSTPSPPGMPYDSTDTGPIDVWQSLDDRAGSCDLTSGRCNGDHFTDSGPWSQC